MSTPYSESALYSEDRPWLSKRVNLAAFEASRNYEPIYTRKWLEDILKIRTGADAPDAKRQLITLPDINGLPRIILRQLAQPHRANISVDYLNYVELAPDYLPHRMDSGKVLDEWDEPVDYPTRPADEYQYSEMSINDDRISTLFSFNKATPLPKGQLHPLCPAFFTYTRPIPGAKLANRSQEMENLRLRQRKWSQSLTAFKFIAKVTEIAKKTCHIKKLVCFGLGTIVDGPFAKGSSLQHMAALRIAQAIDKVNKKRFGKATEPVQIILQDPMYKSDELDFLEAIYFPKADTRIVRDPEGLLALDENTFVMSFKLPVTVPMMQIVADLFATANERPGNETFEFPGAPAAFMLDAIDLTACDEYDIRDRYTPRVKRFLNDYKTCGVTSLKSEREESGWMDRTALYWREE